MLHYFAAEDKVQKIRSAIITGSVQALQQPQQVQRTMW
jgi:hypothetical protein